MVRSEKTRQLIIEKTARIFNEKGYTGTYLSDLTDATGLTKGSIYGNFKDKNEVAIEAFRYNYKFQSEPILRKIELEDNAVSKLLVFLEHYKLAYKPIFENGGCAILNTAVDADNGNESLRTEVVKAIRGWHKRVADILTAGIEQKEIKPVNVEQWTYRMLALIEGSILLAKTLKDHTILLNNIDMLMCDVEQLAQE
ncbi:MAG: TetR/AcrR family transcriptional regulator [Bacteroidia bacterium]|nr:TetR/AcrR family transcriptional regulator [Bacteroidia bacterium]